MKIALLCHPGIGGSARSALLLGRALAETGDTVYAMSTAVPAGMPPEHGMQVRVAEVPGHPVLDKEPVTLAVAGALARLARHEHIDVIHAHFALPWAAAGVMACELLGKRAPALVATLHGSDVFGIGAHPAYVETTRFALERATAVTAVSAALKDASRSELGLDRDIEVVPNFVRTARAPRAAPAEKVPVLAHASTFRAVKRPADAVEVFARVRHDRKAVLRLIGDGPELQTAMARAKALGVADDVEATGAVSDIGPLLEDVSILLSPSEREAFGLAALEAQALGVPVIGSAVDGLPEVIAHGVTGILHPPGDLDAMAASARRLLGAPAEREAMGRAARARVCERFDEARAVSRYRAVYAAAARRRLASTAA